MNLSTFNKGYIIGILDGEGYVSVTRHFLRKSGKFNYRARIDITTTDIRLVKKIMGLKLQTRVDFNPSKKKECHKPRYIIRFLGPKLLLQFLNIIPIKEFVIKKKQILLLKKFCEERLKTHYYTGIEDGYYRKMLKLNKRGLCVQ